MKHIGRGSSYHWRFLILIEVYIDGASKGNPGPSGAGVFIKGVQPAVQLSFPLGQCPIMKRNTTLYLRH